MIAGFLATLLLAGCGLVARPRPAATLRFEFAATTGDGYMNQLLTIYNDSTQMLAPTLEFTALDATRSPLPTVKVTTVYGSDLGKLVVPPGGGVDVLIFTGEGAQLAEDVVVSVRATETVKAPAVHVEPVVTPVDESGHVLDRNSRFTAVSLCNDDSEQMSVRLVYIIWAYPEGDQRQQADQVVPVGDLIVVPPKQTTLVPVAGEARTAMAGAAGRFPTSIKAYLSR
ncbi:hypothetical protein ONA91_38240 [Micromonospora sp. DR5-3]|uniref:hypothetical protein n=1 Tax=unclassified Micromonospora TaxID=2617518 RepID=UPI0011D5B4D0|nr:MULTISPECIES: hypothetical protein [unclassified Micromonospora]MCW3820286.1 hypothetical protein [Micromonospora sp. DR5-3]TYC19483.1 hypothetical protein FXF52_36300 [Micromonospora sp. MP36]